VTTFERFATRSAVFAGGALLMATEIAAFRIIGKSFGTALRETTAVIAVFLTAMSLGYWAGGRSGDRWPRLTTLVLTLLMAAATLIAVPALDGVVSPRIATSNMPIQLHAFLVTALLFGLPAGFFASISPIAIRLFATSAVESGSTAGSISALSTAGSIAGSVITGFFLLEWLESINRTITFLALTACGTAAVLLLSSMPRLTTRWRALSLATGVAAVVVAVSLALFAPSSQFEPSLMQDGSGWKLLFSGDSAYHHITVREKNKRRVLAFGIGAQSIMRVDDPNGPGASYVDACHLGRLIRPNMRRVMIIGLGGGTAAKQFTSFYPDVEVDAVEVDPVVARIAQQYFELRPDRRLRLHISDGRTFLQRTNEKWDLIIIDAYTTNRYGTSIPPHLVTREFFAEAARHLNPGGIVHFHCAFSETALLMALQKTMSNVFTYTFTSGGEILGSNVAILTSKETLAERVSRTPAARLPSISSYVGGFQPVALLPGSVPLLTDDFAPIDMLLGRVKQE